MFIKLFASANMVGSEEEMVVEVPDDIADEALDNMARDFMNDHLAPEYGWEETDETDDVEDLT